jgi:hypothetical protein
MEEELDSLVRGFFSVFDNRNKCKPEFAMLRSICAEGAVIAKRTAESMEICSLVEFWRPRQALLTDGSLTDFHEWEVASETAIHGGIATRICRYKKEGLLRGESYSGSGTKFMHFVLTQEGWKITAVLWEDEDERSPAKKLQRYGSGAIDGMHQDVATVSLQ